MESCRSITSVSLLTVPVTAVAADVVDEQICGGSWGNWGERDEKRRGWLGVMKYWMRYVMVVDGVVIVGAERWAVSVR